jgi:hypothetical protein
MKEGIKNKRPAKYIEHDIQMKIVSFCRTYYKNKVHIIGSDGTSKSAREGDKKNKLGYEKGNPDLIIIGLQREILPLFIELKRPKTILGRAGKESEDQLLKRQTFIKVGYTWLVIDDIQDGIMEIKRYFDL